MRNSIFSSFLLLTLLFFTTCKSPVEVELYGNLAGTVTDAVTKAPIEGAIVTLSPSSASTSTGSDGKYSFTKLDPLEYKIQVTIEGYATNTKNLTVKAGESTTGDLSLTSVQPVLEVSEMNLDFGEDQTLLPLVISNTGKSNLTWNVIESTAWISVNPTSGTTTVQKSSAIITIDRTGMSAGTYNQMISVISNGGTKLINISMIVANQFTPKVTTGSPINVSQTTADITGSVTSIGAGVILKHGHCYSKLPNPTFLDLKTDLGTLSAAGAFTSSFSGLDKNTTYYVRAYATNANGTGYSTQVTFTTSESPTLPNVTITDATSITVNAATVGGGLASVGSTNIIEHGHCWSVTTNPSITNTKTTLGSKSAIGLFSSNLTTLLPGTTYYIKAYATNSAGTTYSPEISFTTLPTPAGPTVTSGTISSVTLTGAQAAGNLTNMGTSNVTQHGHCWSTTTSPTVSNFKTQLGTKTFAGAFSSTITGLEAGKTYYVRAYAVNSDGTSYGAQVEFKTVTPTAPTVNTGSVNSISLNGAQVVGNVSDLGTSNVTQYGHCWSSGQNPTTSNAKTMLGAKTDVGSFTSALTGLEKSTIYFVRAYATNSDGTNYGTQVQFTTLSPALATLTTSSASNLTYNSATLNGSISDIGGTDETVTEYGFCYATTSSPTVASTKLIAGNNKTTTGSFTSDATGLSQNTTYYVRTYAINSAGAAYGTEQTFKTTADPYTVSDGLLAFYNFDAQNCKDAFGNFNGISSGGVLFNTSTPNSSGYSIEFNGTSGFVNIPYKIIPSSGSWTISLWIKSIDETFGLFDFTTSTCPFIDIESSKLGACAGNGFNGSVSLSNLLLNNSWHNLVICYDGSTFKYLIDGDLVESKTAYLTFNGECTIFGADIYGGSPQTGYYKGLMDNIRFYNRILTTTEITTLYNAKQ